MKPGIDSSGTKTTLTIANKRYSLFSLAGDGLSWSQALPKSLKILLENMLRFEDGKTVKLADIEAFKKWLVNKTSNHEISFRPSRVLMQDFTGVPAIVDLAAMRDAMKKLGGDPENINPRTPVDLVIDHSVMVDFAASHDALVKNVEFEYRRNGERYSFLKWGQKAFDNFRVVPPGTGICHQVNLEYLAKTVWSTKLGDETFLYPDSLVGTDSHTTMVNGLSVLGWGVGGIEAEAAMLGQPISMLIPDVIGVKISGKMSEGITATDLVLTVTEILRKKGVVGKFVEFFGDALVNLSLENRATIANMAPEYGATCGFFPIDNETLRYLRNTGRDDEQVTIVEKYAKLQGLWYEEGDKDPEFTEVLEIDLSSITPCLAGPKRPQDRVEISNIKQVFETTLFGEYGKSKQDDQRVAMQNHDYTIGNGDVAIAAITSCTNTSNPSVLIAAGLVAKNAVAKGLNVKPWVKTSLAPGSQVVSDYLQKSGLQAELDSLGFHTVGYGCTTCIGNSGPLDVDISLAVKEHGLALASVLSGNRNFEGRISSEVMANFLASPPLVVAFALMGTVRCDIINDPIGKDHDGKEIYLRDIWPSNEEISQYISKFVSRDMYKRRYATVFDGDDNWAKIEVDNSPTFAWAPSTYVAHPPYFSDLAMKLPEKKSISRARILALLGDMITTDHISPAGAIKSDSPAGEYLKDNGVEAKDFNSYGSRRGNHEVMMRGTFANIRIKNLMLDGVEGGMTKYLAKDDILSMGKEMSIYDAAQQYKSENRDLVVVAGTLYGTGSSRDWAAKGTNLLGVQAVIAGSYERIHRSNLIGMAVLPLQFKNDQSWKSLGLCGDELIDITGVENIVPKSKVKAIINRADGSKQEIELLVRIDTDDEMDYYNHGGILQYVLRQLAS